MKIVRYKVGDGVALYGELRGGRVHPLDGEFPSFRPGRGEPHDLDKVKLLAPATPTKIVAIGPGYRKSMGDLPVPVQPMFWIKPASAVNDPDGVIELPPNVPEVCHEAELAIVIGKTARRVNPKDAEQHIFGHTCMNEVTAGRLTEPREFMSSHYFVDGKIFDTFAPFGPCIETDLGSGDLMAECRVNGEVRQRHSTSDRLWSSAELVAMISNILTLFPGDIISTGSIPNPQPMRHGDTVEIEIENIGVLRNYVRDRI